MIAVSKDEMGFDLLVVSPSSFLLSMPFLPSHLEKPFLPPPNRFLRIGNSLLTAEAGGSNGSGFSFCSLFNTIEERFDIRSLKSSVVDGVLGMAVTALGSVVFLAMPNHPDFFLRTAGGISEVGSSSMASRVVMGSRLWFFSTRPCEDRVCSRCVGVPISLSILLPDLRTFNGATATGDDAGTIRMVLSSCFFSLPF